MIFIPLFGKLISIRFILSCRRINQQIWRCTCIRAAATFLCLGEGFCVACSYISTSSLIQRQQILTKKKGKLKGKSNYGGKYSLIIDILL